MSVPWFGTITRQKSFAGEGKYAKDRPLARNICSIVRREIAAAHQDFGCLGPKTHAPTSSTVLQVSAERRSKPTTTKASQPGVFFFFSPSPFRNLSQSLHWLKLENSLSWGYLAKHQARQFPSYAVVTTSAAHFNLYAFHG